MLKSIIKQSTCEQARYFKGLLKNLSPSLATVVSASHGTRNMAPSFGPMTKSNLMGVHTVSQSTLTRLPKKLTQTGSKKSRKGGA